MKSTPDGNLRDANSMSDNHNENKATAIGINHIALEVDDIAEALAFYGAFLRFEVTHQDDDAAFVYLGDQFINFSRGRTQAPDARRHFGIAVDNKELVRHILERIGIELAESRFLNFLDPWGNRVEITTYTNIQFSKAESVLNGMGMGHLTKSDQALKELRDRGLAPEQIR